MWLWNNTMSDGSSCFCAVCPQSELTRRWAWSATAVRSQHPPPARLESNHYWPLNPDPSTSVTDLPTILAHKAPPPPSQRHQSALGSSAARAPRGRSKARQRRSRRLKEGETPPVPKDHTLCTSHPPSVVAAIWTQCHIKHIPEAWPTPWLTAPRSMAASRKSKLYKSSSNQNPLHSGSLYHHQPFFHVDSATVETVHRVSAPLVLICPHGRTAERRAVIFFFFFP